MTAERPKHLIKYVSADAGLAILSSQSLLWSSPNHYSSPFEMNGKCAIPFSSKELLDATVKLSTSLIFSDEKPKGETPLMTAINRWRDEGRFNSPQEAENVLKDLLGRMVSQKEEQLHASLQKWQMFVESVRTCCFCASPDLPLAWEKFADQHKGIAISVIPDAENGLEQVQPVQYTSERPQLTTLKEQINQLLYNLAVNPNQRFPKNLLSKPSFLSEEREWRALMPKNASFRKTDDPCRDEKMLTKGSIRAIYLGLNSDEATRNAVKAACSNMEKHPKLYQIMIAKNQFKLEAAPIP